VVRNAMPGMQVLTHNGWGSERRGWFETCFRDGPVFGGSREAHLWDALGLRARRQNSPPPWLRRMFDRAGPSSPAPGPGSSGLPPTAPPPLSSAVSTGFAVVTGWSVLGCPDFLGGGRSSSSSVGLGPAFVG